VAVPLLTTAEMCLPIPFYGSFKDASVEVSNSTAKTFLNP